MVFFSSNIIVKIFSYLVPVIFGSGVTGSNVVEGGGDCGSVAASSSSKICATIVSMKAPRVLKNI